MCDNQVDTECVRVAVFVFFSCMFFNFCKGKNSRSLMDSPLHSGCSTLTFLTFLLLQRRVVKNKESAWTDLQWF